MFSGAKVPKISYRSLKWRLNTATQRNA